MGSVLQISRLGKQKMAALTSRARRLGMTPQRYVQHLIDEDLALDRQAKETTFAQLMGPPRRPIDEKEIDRLVDEARTRHHRRLGRRP